MVWQNSSTALGILWKICAETLNPLILLRKDGARCRFRTYDPYRVKVMLYH